MARPHDPAAPKKPPLDLLEELDFLPEWILDEIQDPLSVLSPGEAARRGAALSVLGSTITENTKTALMGARARTDHGVTFDTVEATSYPTVNNDAVKKHFPQEQYPHLYRTQKRKAHVTADLPFDTKKVKQLLAA